MPEAAKPKDKAKEKEKEKGANPSGALRRVDSRASCSRCDRR